MRILFTALFALLLAGCAAGKTVERRNYEQLGAPGGPFSHAVKHRGVLYLSGMTAFGTPAQGKSMPEQARAIWGKIRTVAEAEGTDLGSLLKVTMYITDFSRAAELREELLRQYDGEFPASSLVEVNKLFSPEVNIEIEAVFGL